MQQRDGQQGNRKDGRRTSGTRRVAAGVLFAAAAYCVYAVPGGADAREALRAQVLWGTGAVVAIAAATAVLIFTPAPSAEGGADARRQRVRRGPFDLSQGPHDETPPALAGRAEVVPRAGGARDDVREGPTVRPPAVAPGLLAELEPLAWSAPPPEPRRARLAPAPVVVQGGDESSREALARLLRRGGYYVKFAETDSGTRANTTPGALRLALAGPAEERADVPA